VKCLDRIKNECPQELIDDMLNATALIAVLEWNDPEWITNCIDINSLKESKMILELLEECRS